MQRHWRLAALLVLVASGAPEGTCADASCPATNGRMSGMSMLQVGRHSADNLVTSLKEVDDDQDAETDQRSSDESKAVEEQCACCAKMCTMYGDPHTYGFDTGLVDRGIGAHTTMNYQGTVYAVKSDTLQIQIEALEGHGEMTGLAVGGSLLDGHKLTMRKRTGEGRFAEVRWDGEPILEEGEVVSKKVDGKSKIFVGLYDDYLEPDPEDMKKVAWDKYMMEKPSDTRWGDKGLWKGKAGYYKFILPGDLTIFATGPEYFATIIKMRKQPNQDGLCGNFDGDMENDAWHVVKSRMGDGHQVADEDNLFNMAALPETAADEEHPSKKNSIALPDMIGPTLSAQEVRQIIKSMDPSAGETKCDTDAAFRAKAAKACGEVVEEPEHADCIFDVCVEGKIDAEEGDFQAEILGSLASHGD